MPAVVTLILQLLTELPGAVSSIETLYNDIKPLLSASDQATLDAAFANLNPKVLQDVETLASDAEKAAGVATS
jgi:hypothetical protein